MAPGTYNSPPTARAIWIALILTAGVMIAAAAGLLAFASGANVAASSRGHHLSHQAEICVNGCAADSGRRAK
jgi:Co/Zn/Cd efflux system component